MHLSFYLILYKYNIPWYSFFPEIYANRVPSSQITNRKGTSRSIQDPSSTNYWSMLNSSKSPSPVGVFSLIFVPFFCFLRYLLQRSSRSRCRLALLSLWPDQVCVQREVRDDIEVRRVILRREVKLWRWLWQTFSGLTELFEMLLFCICTCEKVC